MLAHVVGRVCWLATDDNDFFFLQDLTGATTSTVLTAAPLTALVLAVPPRPAAAFVWTNEPPSSPIMRVVPRLFKRDETETLSQQ